MHETKGADSQKPPARNELPAAIPRSARAGPRVSRFSVSIEVVTPILGGGAAPRCIDDVDFIRVPTVRGHLRFWWRALNAHAFREPGELWEKEATIWGRAADEKGGRGAVSLRVVVTVFGASDESDIEPQTTPGAYALWPARGQKSRQGSGDGGTRLAPRRQPGTRFHLEVLAPEGIQAEIRDAVRAWVLFGGYGSRTRRGLGSLTVTEEKERWLPAAPSRDAFERLWGRDVFAAPGGTLDDTPWLAGASLEVGRAEKDAESAWTAALGWLQEFRQGCEGPEGGRAREPGRGRPQPQRPSISNWPEADKIRHLCRKTRGHPPRHGSKPAWPRAGFGLPIVGRFQTKHREGGKLDEPGPFTLIWRDRGGREHDRLASPLIVKALPLADGAFVPCALWLNRASPGGRVALKDCRGSEAPFDLLLAPDDEPQFEALRGKSSLREAFLDWLRDTKNTNRLAP